MAGFEVAANQPIGHSHKPRFRNNDKLPGVCGENQIPAKYIDVPNALANLATCKKCSIC